MKNKPKQIMKPNFQLNTILINEIEKKSSKNEKKMSQLG
jgi:hypothetical protein